MVTGPIIINSWIPLRLIRLCLANNFMPSKIGCKIAKRVFLLTLIRFCVRAINLRSTKVKKATPIIIKTNIRILKDMNNIITWRAIFWDNLLS